MILLRPIVWLSPAVDREKQKSKLEFLLLSMCEKDREERSEEKRVGLRITTKPLSLHVGVTGYGPVLFLASQNYNEGQKPGPSCHV